MKFLTCLMFTVLTIGGLGALDKSEYKIYIVSDTLDFWAVDIHEGFRATLDRQLAALGAKAVYTVFDTKLDVPTAAGIVAAIQQGKPDLVLMSNYPNGFADSQITTKLSGAPYRFVSLNPIPVEMGLIKSWQKPGGNVTGVGVFIQFTSTIKLAQRLNPQLKKVAFVTWEAMGTINTWFESEMKKAARETGVELVEFRRSASVEDDLEFFTKYRSKATDTFVMIGITAFVHRDGRAIDAKTTWNPFLQNEMGKLLMVTYDDSTVERGVPAATAVIWTDIGAQAAEKGLKILQGANPGDLPWEFPRKYNLVFNLKAATARGLTIPPALISSAYRVYTDYEGAFVGKK